MLATIKDVEFVCVEERDGKKGKYWLYSFLSNGKLVPAIYGKEKFSVDGVKNCILTVELGSYNGNLNMRLVNLAPVK